MKIKLLITKITCVAFAIGGTAHGASYAVTSGVGADANGIAPSTGTGYAGNGVVALGFFSSSFNFGAVTSGADLITGFTQFGVTDSFLDAGLFGNAGVFELSTAGTVTSSSFSGENMFLMVGNGADFSSSTEFLVLRETQLFNDADDSSGTPIDVTFSDASSLMFGATDPDIRTLGSDSTVTPGFRTQAIPEPSTAILGLLGMLGLLRRRRTQ